MSAPAWSSCADADLQRRGGNPGAHDRVRARRAAEFWTRAEDIPAAGGAYVLLIDLREPVVARIRDTCAPLAAGRYLYCGSAKGPGGLGGRIARHMRRGKSFHWHIDVLTVAGSVLGAWTFPGANECDLVAHLAHLPMPIEGFGSSDCRRCISHLLHWPHGT